LNQRICRKRKFLDRHAADEMLLNNALADFGRNAVVPRSFGINDGNRPPFANAQAADFRAINAAIILAQFLQAFLEITPRRLAVFERTTIRPEAQQNVPLIAADIQAARDFF